MESNSWSYRNELPDEAAVLLDHALMQLGIIKYEQVELEAIGASDIPLLYLDPNRIEDGEYASRIPTWTLQIKMAEDYLEWVDTHWRGVRWQRQDIDIEVYSRGEWIVYYEGPQCL